MSTYSDIKAREKKYAKILRITIAVPLFLLLLLLLLSIE